MSIWTKTFEECLQHFVKFILQTIKAVLKEKSWFSPLDVPNKVASECTKHWIKVCEEVHEKHWKAGDKHFQSVDHLSFDSVLI